MKKYSFLLLLFLLSAIVCDAANRAEKLAKIFKDPKTNYVLVCAHRGDWRNAPENSLQAYKNCIEMGVDMVEIDIHKTKDGKFVIMHDKTVDRTTNGKGLIAEMTYDEISRLKLRAGHGVVTNHKVPTLEEVLNLVKGKILVNIDKGDNYFDDIYDILVNTGTLEQVVIKTYDNLETIQKKSKHDVIHKTLFMPIVNLDKKGEDAEVTLNEYLDAKAAGAVEVTFKQETPKAFRVMQNVLKANSKLWLNSLWPSLNGGHCDDLSVEEGKPDEGWGWLLKQGAKIIQSDRPAALIKYLREKKRHD